MDKKKTIEKMKPIAPPNEAIVFAAEEEISKGVKEVHLTTPSLSIAKARHTPGFVLTGGAFAPEAWAFSNDFLKKPPVEDDVQVEEELWNPSFDDKVSGMKTAIKTRLEKTVGYENYLKKKKERDGDISKAIVKKETGEQKMGDRLLMQEDEDKTRIMIRIGSDCVTFGRDRVILSQFPEDIYNSMMEPPQPLNFDSPYCIAYLGLNEKYMNSEQAIRHLFQIPQKTQTPAPPKTISVDEQRKQQTEPETSNASEPQEVQRPSNPAKPKAKKPTAQAKPKVQKPKVKPKFKLQRPTVPAIPKVQKPTVPEKSNVHRSIVPVKPKVQRVIVPLKPRAPIPIIPAKPMRPKFSRGPLQSEMISDGHVSMAPIPKIKKKPPSPEKRKAVDPIATVTTKKPSLSILEDVFEHAGSNGYIDMPILCSAETEVLEKDTTSFEVRSEPETNILMDSKTNNIPEPDVPMEIESNVHEDKESPRKETELVREVDEDENSDDRMDFHQENYDDDEFNIFADGSIDDLFPDDDLKTEPVRFRKIYKN